MESFLLEKVAEGARGVMRTARDAGSRKLPHEAWVPCLPCPVPKPWTF